MPGRNECCHACVPDLVGGVRADHHGDWPFLFGRPAASCSGVCAHALFLFANSLCSTFVLFRFFSVYFRQLKLRSHDAPLSDMSHLTPTEQSLIVQHTRGEPVLFVPSLLPSSSFVAYCSVLFSPTRDRCVDRTYTHVATNCNTLFCCRTAGSSSFVRFPATGKLTGNCFTLEQ